MRNVDGFNYLDIGSYHVDGYGMHLYPFADQVAQNTHNTLQRDVVVLGHDKPIWLTEWGLDSRSFPNKSGETRAEAAADFYATLERFQVASFGPFFYFAYDWVGGKGLTDPNGNLLPDARAVMRAP